MREINECTAEVFRRSEKRIKERKRNRNRILTLCIPLCLIVTVWSVMILPAMLPASKNNDGAENFMDIAGGTDVAYVRVEVMSAGTATQSTILKDDTDEVSQIYYTVQSFFVSPGEGNKESVESAEDDALTEENKDYSQSGTTTDLFSGYRIIFTAENGIQTIYSLVGDKFINESTKQETVLTADQRSDLLNMLGLTITWEEDPQ